MTTEKIYEELDDCGEGYIVKAIYNLHVTEPDSIRIKSIHAAGHSVMECIIPFKVFRDLIDWPDHPGDYA